MLRRGGSESDVSRGRGGTGRADMMAGKVNDVDRILEGCPSTGLWSSACYSYSRFRVMHNTVTIRPCKESARH